jgi:hypothetical protein
MDEMWVGAGAAATWKARHRLQIALETGHFG